LLVISPAHAPAHPHWDDPPRLSIDFAISACSFAGCRLFMFFSLDTPASPHLRSPVHVCIVHRPSQHEKVNFPKLRRAEGLFPARLTFTFGGIAMSEQSVVGVYKSMDEAERAVHELDRAKFPIDQVTIVTKDIATEKKVHGYVTACDVSK